jgi:hypothetical protein
LALERRSGVSFRIRNLSPKVNPMRSSRSLLALALPALLAGGCTFLTGGRPDPFGPGGIQEGTHTFTLRIDNATRHDARVQIIWGASARSLGTIRFGEGENFRLPVEGRSFRLQVDFVDGPRGFETRPISVRPDQFVRYRIPS